mgnify:CR=1 FL=1
MARAQGLRLYLEKKVAVIIRIEKVALLQATLTYYREFTVVKISFDLVIAEITATPSAPAFITLWALDGLIPPMPTIGR